MNSWGSGAGETPKLFTTPLPGPEVLGDLHFDAAILDVACGYGRVLRHLADLGYTNLTGNDISPELIASAHSAVPEARFFTGDMTKFTAAKDFALVLLMGSIEYVLDDDEQAAFIRHIRGLLAANGALYLDTFILDPEVFEAQYCDGFQKTSHWGLFANSKGLQCHHSSYERMQALLSDGFEIQFERKHKITTWSGRKVNGYAALVRKV